MKILYCKDLWWPFGSHLTHCMYRKIFCDMNNCKFLYTKNKFPIYSDVDSKISHYFSSMSDEGISEQLIKYIEKEFSNANHNNSCLLEFSEDYKLISSSLVTYDFNSVDRSFPNICHSGWDKFLPSEFKSIKEYQSSIIKKISTPSEYVKNFLNNNLFIKKISQLNGNYIGIHIRWTDKVDGWVTEADFYDVDVYFKYALELRDKTNINNIVICCDNIDALNKMQDYNLSNNLSFNIYYDEEEVLPKNDWRECIFQKWANHSKDLSKENFIKDFLNGFKIYKALFESKALIGNLDSNMCLVPFIARNCELDINITGNPTGRHGISNAYWSKNIISKRLKGNEIRKQEFRK